MEFYPPLEEARLIRRYKRFLADVITLAGETLCIHCPNTGSMLNCMQEGGRVWFQRSDKPGRKLPATWELAETPQGRLACINTQRANTLVEEALTAGLITELAGFSAFKREVPYGAERSRADFRLDYLSGSLYLEVKSVTLGFSDSEVAAFPDAVTERGQKHLRELTHLAYQGVGAALLYCVCLSGMQAVRPALEIDPKYAQALITAQSAGVRLLAYAVELSPKGMRITKSLPLVWP